MREILVLADADELPGVIVVFREAAPGAVVRGVSDVDALDLATTEPPEDLRLVAFCTGVIVPRAVLDRLGGPAYNLHPGPPQARGIYPAVFALYHGMARYGATLHELTAELDAGPIVATDYADIPEGIDRLGLEVMARNLVTGLLRRMAGPLVMSDGPLPRTGEEWSGPAWSRKDFDALCRLPDDVTEAEFRRRLRAVGEGPDHALNFVRFGRRFSLDPLPGAGPVVKGGRPVGS